MSWTFYNAAGAPVAAARPPGYEYDYVQKTTDTSITATSAATATTILTGGAVAYDGSTTVEITVSAAQVSLGVNGTLAFELYEDGVTLSRLVVFVHPSTTLTSHTNQYLAMAARLRKTPAAGSHTYSLRAWATATETVHGGAGTAGAIVPVSMRITKV